jgi:alpha-tubulin suppressor-like RCC1 family protein
MVWSCLNNFLGNLGLYINTSGPRPTFLITNFPNVPLAVSAGFDHTIVVDSTGTLRSFGRNNYGQLVMPFNF